MEAITDTTTEPPPQAWSLYTDGSGSADEQSPAGWGVAVYDGTDTDAQHCLFELRGPILTNDTDQRFLGATKQTNNTAELTAIAEALLWLDQEAPGRRHKTATVYYDSQYAAEIIQSSAEPHQNMELANQCRSIYQRLRAMHHLRRSAANALAYSAMPENAAHMKKLAQKGRPSTRTNNHVENAAPCNRIAFATLKGSNGSR